MRGVQGVQPPTGAWGGAPNPPRRSANQASNGPARQGWPSGCTRLPQKRNNPRPDTHPKRARALPVRPGLARLNDAFGLGVPPRKLVCLPLGVRVKGGGGRAAESKRVAIQGL